MGSTFVRGRRRRRRGGTCGWRRALTAADLHVVICVQTAVRVADPTPAWKECKGQ